jgi:TRAP-type C4-dicarboxylate transport system substrate-binding protein
MRNMQRTRLAAIALAMTTLAAAGGGGVAANGDAAAPVTLKLGSYNDLNSPFAGSVTDFVADVATNSNGNLTIEPVWRVLPDDPTASMSGYVFDSLKGGSLDMIIIGARMLDEAGATSFDALQTPFLIDSDTLLNAVATDGDITKPMLDGLSAAGMVGLAVLPEGLRHPTSFKAPFLKLSDFTGTKILTIPAVVPDAMIQALGAEPSGLVANARIDAIASGDLDGIDFSYGWLNENLLGAMGTTTGNITTYPTYNVLAVSQAAWDRLTDTQRELLRQTAATALQKTVASNPSDATLSADYCAVGGTVVLADAADVAAIAGATAPVVATLQADPVTKDLIARIQTLKDGLPVPPVATACEPPAAPAVSPRPEGTPAALPPNGTFRADVPAQDLVDAGETRAYAAENAGLITITFAGDAMTQHWDGTPVSTDCHETLTIVGDHVHVHHISGCTGDFDFRWAAEDGGLRLDAVGAAPADLASAVAFYNRLWAEVK